MPQKVMASPSASPPYGYRQSRRSRFDQRRLARLDRDTSELGLLDGLKHGFGQSPDAFGSVNLVPSVLPRPPGLSSSSAGLVRKFPSPGAAGAEFRVISSC